MNSATEPRRLSNYGDGADLLVALNDSIAGARTRLWVKVPWWDVSPLARKLLDGVLAAHRRGVEVRVLCRPEASNDAVLRTLRDAGVPLTAVRYIHEKEIIADAVAITHSMNFTSAEISRNQNSGFVHTDPAMVEAVELGFLSLLENASAVTEGEESWTPASALIPDALRKYLDRFDRLN